jgi:hypothetical protein
VSVLSRPQSEWDEFLSKDDRRERRLDLKRLLVVTIPLGLVLLAFVLARCL